MEFFIKEISVSEEFLVGVWNLCTEDEIPWLFLSYFLHFSLWKESCFNFVDIRAIGLQLDQQEIKIGDWNFLSNVEELVSWNPNIKAFGLLLSPLLYCMAGFQAMRIE
jgi:hypothetical protein